MFWRALLAKQLALFGFEDALKNLPTLCGFRICYTHSRNRKPLFRIPSGELFPDLQRGLRDESQATPLKIRTQFKDLSHSLQRRAVSFPRNNALVLIFDLRFSIAKLAQEHDDRLQKVQRLEATNDDRFALVLRDPFVRSTANHSRAMPGANKRIKTHIG